MNNKKPILFIEDDSVDVMTVKRALKELHINNRLDIAGDGEEALEYLNNPVNKLPCIILLDLNMPRMNGIEFLKIAKGDKKLKSIPVVILTTSREEQDKIDSFELGVSGYMLKPVEYREFVDVIRTINLYWTLSELPE